MVRRSPVNIILEAPTYIKKSVTIHPDGENQLFSLDHIRKYCTEKMKGFKEGSNVVITAMNILRETTLKGFNDDFMTDDQYDEYMNNKVDDSEKFQFFHNFTITIREPK